MKLIKKYFPDFYERIQRHKRRAMIRKLSRGGHKKTVLIIEVNDFHGECLPGYIKYFHDLGYHVHMFATNRQEKSGFLSRVGVPVKLFCLPKYDMIKCLERSDFKKGYDFVLIATSQTFIQEKNAMGSLFSILKNIPSGKFGFLVVEHNIRQLYRLKHDRFVAEQKAFSLNGQRDIPMLNPHWFGDVKISDKNARTVFAATVNKTSEMNKDTLFNAVKQLVLRGINNFKVIIVGRTVVESIPDDLKEYVEMTGIVDFPKLWQVYDGVDFLMPMLNPEEQGEGTYKDYSTSAVTGSYQTMLGFLKPFLLHSYFCDSYRLNKNNAVIYDSTEKLVDAMERAINMNADEYKGIQENLRALEQEIYTTSLNNLKSMIALHSTKSTNPPIDSVDKIAA